MTWNPINYDQSYAQAGDVGGYVAAVRTCWLWGVCRGPAEVSNGTACTQIAAMRAVEEAITEIQ